MAITLNRVNTLLGSSADSRASLWAAFTDATLKQAAVTQANRMLTLANGAALTQEDSGEDDLKRHDLAVALQALHILTTGKAMADGTKSGPKHITADAEGDKAGKAPDPAEALWSREALMYLKGTAQVTLPGAAGAMLLPSSLVMDRG